MRALDSVVQTLPVLLGHASLAAVGWHLEGLPPAGLKKYVLIAAPHTSNYDLTLMLALASVAGVRVSWMGKHTLFKGPGGAVLSAAGGIPVFRSERRNMVDQMADLFAQRDAMVLAVPPEGTRGHTDYWKSGFYHIAKAANVPIVMGYLDYGRKRGGFGPALTPSGDVRADMDQFRAFYGPIQARYPDKKGRIRLKEEDAAEDAQAR